MIDYADYSPFIITLNLHPAFVALLQQDFDKAKLAQGQFTIIPSTLMQLASIVMGEIRNCKVNLDNRNI